MNVIYVCSLSHCGSTVISAVLGAGDDTIKAVGELHWIASKENMDKWYQLREDTPQRWDHYKEVIKSTMDGANVHEAVFKHFPRTKYIVDASKTAKWHKQNFGEGDKSVVIYKSPFQAAVSYYKRGYDIDMMMDYYIKWHKSYLEVDPNAIFVSHQDFAADPAEITEKLCNKLGIEYFEDKYKFWLWKEQNMVAGAVRIVNNMHHKNDERLPKDECRKIYYRDESGLLPEDTVISINRNAELFKVYYDMEAKAI